MGCEVEIDKDALSSETRFAGHDSTRVTAIHRAADSGADVALISRGGYGLTRILDEIDYKKIAKAIDGGTQFVGISDFTAFQLSLFAKTRSISWAGPALCEGFGRGGGPDEIMQACFEDLLLGQGEGAGWKLPAKDVSYLSDLKCPDLSIQNAMLWGGNLCVLTSLLGTPYFPNIRGGILFLEDIAEHPYRIERMLTQLLLAGVLSRQKAIVLGQFTEFKLTPHDKGYNLQKVFSWLRTQLDVPVLTNFPYGHVPTKVLLPVGAKVDLVVQEREALIAWGHIS